MALFTPLFFSEDLAFGVTEAKFFYLFFLTLGLVPFSYLYATERKNVVVTKTDLGIIVFLIYLVICNFETNPYNKKLFYFILSCNTYFSLRVLSVKQSISQRKTSGFFLLNVIYLTAICSCIYAQLQRLNILDSFNSNFKITSTFFHPAPFACFIAIVLPNSFYMLIKLYQQKYLSRLEQFTFLSALVTLILIALTLPLTQSRAAFIAAFIAIVLCSGQIKTVKEKFYKIGKLNKLFVITLASLLLLASFYVVVNIRKDSVSGRLQVWKIASQMIVSHPFNGKGLDSFRSSYPHYQIEYFRYKKQDKESQRLSCEVSFAFNEVIQLTIEMGLIGIVLIIFITYDTLQSGLARIKREVFCRCYISSLIAFLLFALFSYSFSMLELLLYYFVLLAGVNACRTDDSGIKAVPLIFQFVFAFNFLSCYYIGGQVKNNLNSYYTWKIGGDLYSMGNRQGSYMLLNRIFPLLNHNDKFLSFYFRNLFDLKKYSDVIHVSSYRKMLKYDDQLVLGDSYKECHLVAMAEKSYWDAYYLLPHKFTPLYRLMKLYYETNKYKNGRLCAEMILKKEVKLKSDEIFLMKNEALKVYRICNFELQNSTFIR